MNSTQFFSIATSHLPYSFACLALRGVANHLARSLIPQRPSADCERGAEDAEEKSLVCRVECVLQLWAILAAEVKRSQRKTMRIRSRRLFVKASLLVFLMALFAENSRAAKGSNQIDLVVSTVVSIRELASEYVSIAKEGFKQGSPEYIHARELYASARSANVAWSTYVVSALHGGRASNLDVDEKYTNIAKDAQEKEKGFTDYVHTALRPQEHELVSIVSSLVEAGWKLWIQISDRRQSERDRVASSFESTTKWKSWDELTAVAPKPVHQESPAPGNPQ